MGSRTRTPAHVDELDSVLDRLLDPGFAAPNARPLAEGSAARCPKQDFIPLVTVTARTNTSLVSPRGSLPARAVVAHDPQRKPGPRGDGTSTARTHRASEGLRAPSTFTKLGDSAPSISTSRAICAFHQGLPPIDQARSGGPAIPTRNLYLPRALPSCVGRAELRSKKKLQASRCSSGAKPLLPFNATLPEQRGPPSPPARCSPAALETLRLEARRARVHPGSPRARGMRSQRRPRCAVLWILGYSGGSLLAARLTTSRPHPLTPGHRARAAHSNRETCGIAREKNELGRHSRTAEGQSAGTRFLRRTHFTLDSTEREADATRLHPPSAPDAQPPPKSRGFSIRSFRPWLRSRRLPRRPCAGPPDIAATSCASA